MNTTELKTSILLEDTYQFLYEVLDSKSTEDLEFIQNILEQQEINKDNIVYELCVFKKLIAHNEAGFLARRASARELSVCVFHRLRKYLESHLNISHSRYIMINCSYSDTRKDDFKKSVEYMKKILREHDARGLTYSIKYWNG
jgi:hypothetical protein